MSKKRKSCEVETIVDKRHNPIDERWEYLAVWKGTQGFNSWEPQDCLTPQLVADFESRASKKVASSPATLSVSKQSSSKVVVPSNLNMSSNIVRKEIDSTPAREVVKSLLCVKNGQYLIKWKKFNTFLGQSSNKDQLSAVLEHLPFVVLDPACRNAQVKAAAVRLGVDLEYVVDCCMKRCEYLERKRSIGQDKQGLEVKSGHEPEMLNWLPVFSRSGAAFATFKMRALTSKEMAHPLGPKTEQSVMVAGGLSVVGSLTRFYRNFEAFCKIPLQSLQLGPQTLAMGGAVVACLRPLPMELEKMHIECDVISGEWLRRKVPTAIKKFIQSFLSIDAEVEMLRNALETYYDKLYYNSDIDIFMSVESVAARKVRSVKWAKRFRQHLHARRIESPIENSRGMDGFDYGSIEVSKVDAIEDSTGMDESEFYEQTDRHPDKVTIHYVRTPNALTVVGLDPYRNTQVIACERRRPIDLLMDFDLDACGAAFDGSQVFVLPRTRRALNTLTNFVDPFVIRFLRNRRRLAKYDERGFQMLLFEACKHEPRCDVLPNIETRDWWELCVRTVLTSRELKKAAEKNPTTWEKDKAEPRVLAEPLFKTVRFQDPQLRFGRESDLEEYSGRGGCAVCDIANEQVLTASHRIPIGFIEHNRGHMSAFFSRVYGRTVVLEINQPICDAHNTQYRSAFTEAWNKRRSRDVEEEDGQLMNQVPENENLLHADVLTHDGLIYPDEQIPIRALTHRQIILRMTQQQHADRELHARLYGPSVSYIPRVEHSNILNALWAGELRERARPPIGRNPERIMNLCYMCGVDISDGEFSDRLCESCCAINKSARDLLADLKGRVALITGVRTKLGFECAVKLLRCGATIIGLTRFPRVALSNFQALPDYAIWSNSLLLHGLDLRNTPALMNFLETFLRVHQRLDIIINNAAQTVRRPPAYYYELSQRENDSPLLKQHTWSEQQVEKELQLAKVRKEVEDLAIGRDFVEIAAKESDAFRRQSIGQAIKLVEDFPFRKQLLQMLQDHPWLEQHVKLETKHKTARDRGKKETIIATTTLFQTTELELYIKMHRAKVYKEAPRKSYEKALTTEQLNAQLFSSSFPSSPYSTLSSSSSSSTASSSCSSSTRYLSSSSPSTTKLSSSLSTPSLSSSSSSALSLSTSKPRSLSVSDTALMSLSYRSFTIFGDNITRDDAMFPSGQVDRHGEALDLRPFTSWNAKISQVDPLEMLEAQVVNVMAPYLIVSQLGPLMRDGTALHPRFIINVTSQEGQFHTELPKKSFHPHTNMAKAALNMLTRTTAVEFMQDNVSVLSIDPGWVSDMRPTTRVQLIRPPAGSEDSGTSAQVRRVAVAPPLSVADGAARILNPILQFAADESCPAFGVLLKNFKVEMW